MPQWSSRLLTPSSRNQQGDKDNNLTGKSTSPSQPRLRPKLTVPESIEGTGDVASPPSANINNSATSRTSLSASHVRSMSNPFPSFFNSKKKRQIEIPPAGSLGSVALDSTEENTVSLVAARESTNKGKNPKVQDKDLLTGRCMTCDSLVRWPKELNVFRCTVCLTINDLKPLPENRHEDSFKSPTTCKPGAHSESRYPHHPPPLSLEKTRNIIENCITAYLLNHLKHDLKISPPQSNHLDLSGAGNEEFPERFDLGERSPASLSMPPPRRVSIQSNDQQRTSFNSQRKSSSDVRRIESYSYSTSTPGNFFDEHIDHKDRNRSRSSSRIGSLNTRNPSGEEVAAPSRTPHDVKNLFKPLEQYISNAFGSFQCINSSFSTVKRVITTTRAASEGPKKAKAPNPQPMERQTLAESQLSELDAKTLLLGDFAENGSWWTGSRTNLKGYEASQMRRVPADSSHDKDDLVTLRSPRVDWAETNEWYHTILQAGRSWRRILDNLLKSHAIKSETGFLHLQDLSETKMDEIEDQISEARFHLHRVLMKAIEGLLKRPSRPLGDPNDLRFLLIIFANPLLYPASSNQRNEQRNQCHRPLSKSQNIRISQTYGNHGALKFPLAHESTSSSKESSGQHSRIIKRILGLLSNVSNECHHHLVSWFSRYSDTQFQKTVDLIGKFVTYRLLRQQGRKHDVEQDPTAGLIPNISGTGSTSSAALHAALGISGQTSKKSESSFKTVIYNDDWQIKAAARVMSLLFSANNNGSLRRNERRYFTETEGLRSSAAGLIDRERACRHGQIIPTNYFYNSLLDCSDLIADYEAWESRRGKFSFCQYPFFLSIWAKIQIMEHDARRQMEVKAREAFFDSIMNHKAVNQYLVLSVRRDCLVEDSLKAVSEVVGTGSEEIKKGLRISFKGEEGIDAGGLRKEWFLLLVRDVFNPEHGMFTYDEDSMLCYFNPNSFETTDQFFLVGVVLGLAIYNSTILDVALPSFAFRKLLASAPPPTPGMTSHAKPAMVYTLEDLAQYRPALANGFRKLLDYDGDVASTFCRDFVADVENYGQITQVPLCPNGEKRAVTNTNRREFVDLYVRYLLDTAVTRQFEPFKRGFYTVCGGNALSLFRPEEIELLIRGSDEQLDIASLRAVCKCENWGGDNSAETEPVVQWFWETFQAASPTDQRKLLSFITGSDRIPAMGATNLIIKISCLGDDERRYPVARTCFNQLCLWRYSSKQKLVFMLWRAVHESEGFGLR
ncbi:putative E3 ubiquitin-protein ligase [Podosphaera aphanis]|nr:putative E3 ubiquitin-protein ligase [Podosphaera aphanis]